MPPKTAKKADPKGGKNPPKKKEGGGGGKAKKKKWSKGKVRDKLNNAVLFDAATYDKLYKEVRFLIAVFANLAANLVNLISLI